MNPFSRFFSKRIEVPDWAGFFQPDEYQAFLQAVEKDMKRRGYRWTIDDGVVLVPDSAGEIQRWGLQNLAQMCRARDQETWADLVKTHFDNLLACRVERETLQTEVSDYAKVRHLLKVRLLPEQMPDGVEQNAVTRIVAEGVREVLTFDLPSTVVSVTRSDADSWMIPDEELLQDALENVLQDDPQSVQTLDAGDGLEISAILGDSFFTASHVLGLPHYLENPAEHGVLVVIPNRHSVLFHPVEGPMALRAIQALIVMAQGAYRDGPGSISPLLYWWRDGEFMLLPTSIEDDRLVFTPPDEFVEVLERVCEE